MKLAEPTSLWRSVRRWLPGVIISVVALFFVFRIVTFQDLARAFSTIQPLNLAVALVFSVISLIVRAAAWKTILGGKPKMGQSFFIVNEGYMLNNLFPLRAGEIGRALFMGKAINVSPFHILSSIVIERAFDLIFAATFLLTTLPLVLNADSTRPASMITLGLMLLLLAALYLMARYSDKVHAIALKIGGRWALFNRLVIPQVDSLLDGLSALTNLRLFLSSVFWIAMTWAFWLGTYYVMLLPIAPGAPFWWAMFADSILALGVAIPSAPAGLGVYEAAMVFALTTLGISKADALAYALILHLMNLVLTGIFGFWGLMRERQSLSTIFSTIQLKQPSRTE
jgi:uncharacterized protein (TIRG00374 family)